MATKSPFKNAQATPAEGDELPESWPTTPEGRPWYRVTVGASEKIGLENIGLKFSSIECGPVFITGFVPPGATSLFENEDEKLAMTRVLEEAALVLEIDVVAEQREKSLEAIKNSQALAGAIST